MISAGEASGDYYAALLLEELRRRWPDTDFFGCAGAHLRAAGLRPVIRAEDLAVVGVVEVVGHLPRIWRRFRELVAAAREQKPDLAILTDAPDFHFRVAKKLKNMGIPVVYLIAPQVWAWREGRVKTMRRIIDQLLCIFPFEEAFFRARRVPVAYIGHPLAGRVRPNLTREEFFRKHNLPLSRQLVAVLPGSRPSEVLRHIPGWCGRPELLSKDRESEFYSSGFSALRNGVFCFGACGEPDPRYRRGSLGRHGALRSGPRRQWYRHRGGCTAGRSDGYLL